MALANLCRRMAGDDPFDKALRDLERALDANARRMAQIKRRIAEIRRQRSAGRSYREIVEAAKGDLSVQLITEATQALDEFGARVRRTEALALYGEGMTMEEIAEKFGVTRQRVSALLRDAGEEVSGDGGRARPTYEWQSGGTARLASGRGRPQASRSPATSSRSISREGRPPPRPSSSPRTTRARRSGPSSESAWGRPRAPVHGRPRAGLAATSIPRCSSLSSPPQWGRSPCSPRRPSRSTGLAHRASKIPSCPLTIWTAGGSKPGWVWSLTAGWLGAKKTPKFLRLRTSALT